MPTVSEKTFLATDENLMPASQFIEEELEKYECSMKISMQMSVAFEEIFVNVAHYAYGNETGDVTLRTEFDEETRKFKLIFIDSGMPFDPLARENPDITLSADERQIGGLGIFMVKQTMDDVQYEYKDGCNMLTLIKTI